MRIVSIALFFVFTNQLWAQNQVQLTQGKVGLNNTFHPDSIKNVQTGIYTIAKELPEPEGIDANVKAFVNKERQRLENNHFPNNTIKRSALPPMVVGGFIGALNEATPNDNNMAINNDSFVVSVLNSLIGVYNANTGLLKKNWFLEYLPLDPKNTKPGSGIAPLNRSYDPKVVFDPVSNRFIVVYLEGDGSNDTRIIIAFSKTNLPLDGWNIYKLNGNPFGGKFWTDYPMIAINGEDLFVTVNLLKDSTDWRDGFTQSVIWQVQKSKGYAADSLEYNLWSNLKHNNKSIWNICPVQESEQPGSAGLYLLSVRPGDVANDTVFLHHISDNYSSGKAQYSYKILKSNRQYGVPPAAPQKVNGFRLQTNDARVLGAFYNNNKIQFVQTSRNAINGNSSIYHGIIQDPHVLAPSVTANIISYDSLDLAYPTIVNAGNQTWGQQSLITFSHSGLKTFPGTSVIYFDNNGQYSDLIRVKQGQGIINSFIPDTVERWGDYTSIQRRYNNKNEYWLAGSFGKSNDKVGTWIGKITMNDPSVAIDRIQNNSMGAEAYPNPVVDVFMIPFETEAAATIKIEITDMIGKTVMVLEENKIAGDQKAFINVSGFSTGVYYYSVTINQIQTKNGKFSKL
jgi:hypothetical protein